MEKMKFERLKKIEKQYEYYLKNKTAKGEPFTISGFRTRLYKEGVTLEDICKTEKTKNGGANRKPYVFSKQESRRILDLYDYGYKAHIISRKIGKSTSLIRRALKEQGIDTKRKPVLTTRKEYEEDFLPQAKVKWGYCTFRKYKGLGLTNEQIGKRLKKK